MYGHLLSVLLMGTVPAWGNDVPMPPASSLLSVARPAFGGTSSVSLQTEGERISASGAIVMDLESGQVLFERSADVQRPMASLTKLMTALLIVERHPGLTDMVTISQGAQEVGGSALILPAGERFSVKDLLSAMLIASNNEAAQTLALYDAGKISTFAQRMNDRAKILGMLHTNYQNPIGFDGASQTSTPRDLAWLASYVLRNAEIEKRMSTAQTAILSAEGNSYPLSHTHQMLHEDSGVIAGKTGTTDAAGQCLLSIVERGDRRYVVILLHSRDRYRDMRLLESVLPSE